MTRREPLVAALLYAVLACLLLFQAFLPGRTLSSAGFLRAQPPYTATMLPQSADANPQLADIATQVEPFERYTRARLPHAPLWNPFVGGGRPFLANAQSAVFSPYTVPAYVMPMRWALLLSAVLKLVVAALGMFLFCRLAVGLGFGGALLAGTLFGFGQFMVVWMPWTVAGVWSLAPWLLLAADRVARRPAALPVAGLGLVVALQFVAGHPESSFHELVLATGYFVVRLCQRWRAEGRAVVLAPLAAAAGGLALGAALAAAALVPFVELLTRSADLELRTGIVAKEPAGSLMGIVFGNWFGRPTQTPLTADFLVGRPYYLGALALLLAGYALARPSRGRIGLALLGTVAMAVVVGLQPFSWVIQHLPGFSTVHNTRLSAYYVVAVAILAGMGLDDLAGARGRLAGRGRVAFRLFAALLIAGPVLLVAARGYLAPSHLGEALRVAWGFARERAQFDPLGVKITRGAELLVWLPFVLAGVALLAARSRGRLSAHLFTGLVLLVVAGDLFRANVGENPAVRVGRANLPPTAAIRYLQARTPARFVGASTGLYFPLWPNTAMNYGLYDARSYDYPVERRYSRLWRAGVSSAQLLVPSTLLAPIGAKTMPALNLLGVTDVLEAPDGPSFARVPGLRLAYHGADAKIYSNARAMPKLAVVGAARAVPDDASALHAVLAPGFDGRREAIIGQPVAGLSGGTPGTARLVRYAPEDVVARAQMTGTGLLVLDDLHFPGWKATVDGRPAPIVRVDYLLRAVRLGPGTHTVQMRYRPASWTLGWIVSLAALATLLGLAGYGVRQTRTARAR